MLVFEDEYLIAVNKPNNVLVHHSKMANNLTTEKSLVELLNDKYSKKFYPIHRLDRKTSGIVLFSRQKEHIAKFQELFINNKIKKTYFGIVRGFAPISGIINTDVKGRDAKIHKTALTHFKRLNTVELSIAVTPYEKSRYSLLKLAPKTGRLHQLRIHLNKISHPLIGDPKYGDRFHNRMFIKEFHCAKLFLHAKEIEFMHPFTKEQIKITTDFPDDWSKIMLEFNWLNKKVN